MSLQKYLTHRPLDRLPTVSTAGACLICDICPPPAHCLVFLSTQHSVLTGPPPAPVPSVLHLSLFSLHQCLLTLLHLPSAPFIFFFIFPGLSFPPSLPPLPQPGPPLRQRASDHNSVMELRAHHPHTQCYYDILLSSVLDIVKEMY